MKKLFKWISIVLGSTIGLAVVAGLVLVLIGNARLNKTYDFPPSNLTIPTDEASIERENILWRHSVKVATAKTWVEGFL